VIASVYTTCGVYLELRNENCRLFFELVSSGQYFLVRVWICGKGVKISR